MTPLDELREDSDHDVNGNDRQYTRSAEIFGAVMKVVLYVLLVVWIVVITKHLEHS
jgi:hypothetical protein